MTETEGIEKFFSGDELLAIVISHSFSKPGTHFMTPPSFSQQLGFIKYSAGHVINPHLHLRQHRTVHRTLEVLVIRSGRVQVGLYDSEKNFVTSTELGPGDVILLSAGGHGLTFLEDCEMIEIKQGPYNNVQDKLNFEVKE